MGDSYRSPTDLFELVNHRYSFLTALDSGVYRKRELVTELDVSRSTVDRALRELETAQIVTVRTAGYQITLYGRTLLACFESVIDTVAQVERAKPLLSVLPPGVDFEFSLLLDAEVRVASKPAPYTPASRIAELVEDATRIVGLAYAHTSPEAMSLFEEQILAGNTETELVFREEMYAALEETNPDLMAEIRASDNFTGFVASELPYGLFLLSDEEGSRLCLIVYGPDQQLQGIIVNDTPRAVSWGHRMFDRCRSRAVALSLPEPD